MTRNSFANMFIFSIMLSACGIQKYTSTMEQLSTTEIKNTLYSEKEISEDIDYLIRSVEEVAPYPYMNADSPSVHALAKRLKTKGDRMGNELYLDFMLLSAAFNVGHIYTFPPEAMLDEALKKGDRFFPLFIKRTQGKWEVLGIMNNALPEQNVGNEIKKINGTGITEIIRKIEPLVADDGNRDGVIGTSFPFLLWAVKMNHPYSVEMINKETGLPERVDLEGTNDLTKFRKQNPENTKEKLDDFITFEILNQNTGYINAKSFFFAHKKNISKAFTNKLNSYFEELEQKRVSHLIIDLRQNAGGSSYPAEVILQKVAQKPYQQTGGSTMRVSAQFRGFIDDLPPAMRLIVKKGPMKNYHKHPIGTNITEKSKPQLPKRVKNSFSGEVYVLIGPDTHSAAMMMANAIEDFDLGTLVGTPTTSIPRELSNALPLKTPNAKVSFTVPATLFTRANGDAKNFEPVKPDVIIETSPEDLQLKRDPVLQHVLTKIMARK